MKRIPPWLRWLLVAILVALLLLYGYPRLVEFLLVDDCLDSGGRWNYLQRTCES